MDQSGIAGLASGQQVPKPTKLQIALNGLSAVHDRLDLVTDSLQRVDSGRVVTVAAKLNGRVQLHQFLRRKTCEKPKVQARQPESLDPVVIFISQFLDFRAKYILNRLNNPLGALLAFVSGDAVDLSEGQSFW